MRFRSFLLYLFLLLAPLAATAQTAKDIAAVVRIITSYAEGEGAYGNSCAANENGIYRTTWIGGEDHVIIGLRWKDAISYDVTLSAERYMEASLSIVGTAYRMKKTEDGTGELLFRGNWYVQDRGSEPRESLDLSFPDDNVVALALDKGLGVFLKKAEE